MADDLKVRLSVDTSDFKAGMASAAGMTQATSQQMAQAMAQVKIETADLSLAYRQIGSYAAQGEEEAVESIQLQIDRLVEAKNRLADLQAQEVSAVAQATVRSTAAGEGSGDALRVANAAAVQELTAAKERQADVTKAVALANLDEATSAQALAVVDAEVAAAQEKVAATKAALKERSEAATAAQEQETAAQEANATLSASAAQANEVASSALQRYVRATTEKTAASAARKEVEASLNASTLDATEKEAALTAVLQRERAATLEVAAAQKELNVSLQGSMTSNREVVAGMQALGGSAGGAERSVAMLASRFPALASGIAMVGEAAGAAILVYMLYQGVESLGESFDVTGSRARAYAEDVRKVDENIQHSSTSIDVQIDKLQQEQAKLEKKPFNGMKLVLDEAAEAAQNLSERLDGVIQREVKAIEGLSASLPQRILTGGSQTKYEQTMLQEHDKWLGQADDPQGQLRESESYGRSLQVRLDQLKGKQAAADQLAASTTGVAGSLGVSRYEEEIKAVQQMISWQQQEHSNIQKTIDLEKQEGTTQKAKDVAGSERLSASGERAAEKQQRELLQAMEAGRQQQIDEGKLGAQADYDYWLERFGQFTKGGEQYKAVLARMDADKKELGRSNEQYLATQDRGAEIAAKNAESQALVGSQFDVAAGKITKAEGAQRSAAATATYYAERLRVLHDEITRVGSATDITPEDKRNRVAGLQNQVAQTEGERDSAAAESQVRVTEALTEAKERQAAAQERLMAALDRGNFEQAQDAANLRLAAIAAGEADGSISKLSAAHQRAAVHAQEEKDKIAALNKELDDLKDKAKSLKPGSPEAVDNAAQQVAVENKIGQTQTQGAIQQNTDVDTLARQIAQPYITGAQMAENAWMQAQQQMLTGHRTFAQAMRSEEQQMVLSIIEGFEKMLFKSIETDIMKAARHAAANQLTVADDQTAATQRGIIESESNLKSITSSAASAAAKAYNAFAGIPVVGPELGAIAAAATFVAVEGFGAMASFDVGTNFVPTDMIAQIHAGERIIPAADNREMMAAIQSGTGGGRGGPTIHMPTTNHFHGSNSTPKQYARHVEKRISYALARSS